MTNGPLLKALLSASILAIAAPAMAQDPTPIQRLFPVGAGYEVSAKKDLTADGRRTFEGVIVEGIATRSMIDQITFSIGTKNQIEVSIRNLTMRPSDPERPVILLSGVHFLLDDWPADAGAGHCEWILKLAKLQVNGLEARFPETDAAIPGMRIKNMSFERIREKDECWLNGVMAGTSLQVIGGDDSSIAINGLRTQIRMPATAEAAGAPGAPRGAVRASMESLELRRAGRSPAFGFIDVNAGLNVSSETIGPLLSLLERITLTGAKANNQLNLMQILNASTLINADMTITAPVTRIYSAGVVPPEAVTNFSRVGLSTITGKSDYKFSLASGRLLSKAEVSLIGLIDATLAGSMTLAPYPLQKLKAAEQGIDLGAHLIPDASIDTMELKYRDRGLESYVVDLTGVPTGRYITELSGALASGGTDLVKRSFAAIGGEVSEFFRYAAGGYDMTVTVNPPERVNMSRIALLALTDIRGLAGAIGLDFTAKRPDATSKGG